MTTQTLLQRGARWQQAMAGSASVRIAVSSAIVLSMLTAGWKLWVSSRLNIEHAAWPLTAAIAVATTHRVVNAYGWTFVLRSMRLRIDGHAATRIWLAAESRRWLPGGVWGYTSRAAMASRLGINSVTTTASMLLELLLVILASAVVAAAGVVVYGKQLTIHTTLLERGDTAALCGGLLLAFTVVCWLFRRRFSAKLAALRARYRSLQGMQLSTGGVAAAALFFIAMNLIGGWITVVLVRAVPESQPVPILAIMAASSAAWCIGFFAFLSPGGLLVREAALAAMLVPWLPYTDGFALAVMTRIAQLIAEALIICAISVQEPKLAKDPGTATLQGLSAIN